MVLVFFTSILDAASCSDWSWFSFADGAEYLRGILPSFFDHHNMPARRLRRLLSKLPSEGGQISRGNMEGHSLDELHAEINTWLSSASAMQLRQLPRLLTKSGMNNAGEKIENKLQQIDSQLSKLCVEVVE